MELSAESRVLLGNCKTCVSPLSSGSRVWAGDKRITSGDGDVTRQLSLSNYLLWLSAAIAYSQIMRLYEGEFVVDEGVETRKEVAGSFGFRFLCFGQARVDKREP